MKLPDVNVWLAASWARHVSHEVARGWMDAEQDDLALCRITQMGLMRLVTNPAVTGPDCLKRREAWDLMERLTGDPRVRLVAEPSGIDAVWMALSRRDDRSHLLWTDDYLAAFAVAADARLVTLDHGFRRRYPAARVLVLR